MSNDEYQNEDTDQVVCAECEHEYEAEFDEDTGYAVTECPMCGHDQREYGDWDDDGTADAEALASAGHGTDEDYGFYGGDDY